MRNLVGLMQLAYKAGKLKFGYDTLEKLRGDYFLLIAQDLSERTKRDILSKYNFKVYSLFTKDCLGRVFGKGSVGVVIVKRDELGREIERILQQNLKEARCPETSQ